MGQIACERALEQELADGGVVVDARHDIAAAEALRVLERAASDDMAVE